MLSTKWEHARIMQFYHPIVFCFGKFLELCTQNLLFFYDAIIYPRSYLAIVLYLALIFIVFILTYLIFYFFVGIFQ